MSSSNSLEVTAVIRKIISARACLAELPNGHFLTAYFKRKNQPDAGENLLGREALLKISPVDLSQAQIIKIKDC